MNDVDGGPVDRIQWLDYARGVGIILVVFAHTVGGLRAEIVGPKLHNYELIDLLIYSFHMPLFFFVSGVLFAKRLSSTWQYYFRAAAIGIVVPYFLWTIAFVSLQSLVPTEVNNLYNFEALAHIWRQPVGHMWFLYALLIVQIVLLVFVRAFGVPGVIVAGCIFAFLYSLPALHPWLGPVATAIAMGGTFLAMGMTATAWRLIPASRSQAWITFALMAVLWLGSELTLLYLSGPHALAPLVAVFGVCMTMAVCILLPPVQGFTITTLAQLGQASIAIYVAHPIFTAGLRILLYRAGIFDGHLHVWSGTLVGLFAPCDSFRSGKSVQHCALCRIWAQPAIPVLSALDWPLWQNGPGSQQLMSSDD